MRLQPIIKYEISRRGRHSKTQTLTWMKEPFALHAVDSGSAVCTVIMRSDHGALHSPRNKRGRGGGGPPSNAHGLNGLDTVRSSSSGASGFLGAPSSASVRSVNLDRHSTFVLATAFTFSGFGFCEFTAFMTAAACEGDSAPRPVQLATHVNQPNFNVMSALTKAPPSVLPKLPMALRASAARDCVMHADVAFGVRSTGKPGMLGSGSQPPSLQPRATSSCSASCHDSPACAASC